MGIRIQTGLILLSSVALACGGGDDDDTRMDASVREDARVAPDGGAGTEIGPSGGTVSFMSVTITIPPGALAAPTTISVELASVPSLPSGVSAFSPVYRFSPEGLAFALPVQVSMGFAGAPLAPALYWSNDTAGFDRIEGSVAGSVLTAEVLHFSLGFVGSTGGTPPDAGLSDSGPSDAGASDGSAADGGRADSGLPPPDVGPLPSGDTCASAIPLLDGLQHDNQNASGLARDYVSNTCNRAGSYPSTGPDPKDIVYRFDVPPAKQARVSIVSPGPASDTNPFITLVPGPASACATAGTCTAQSQYGLAVHTNSSAITEEVYALVHESYGSSFSIRLDLVDPPAGDSCDTAATLPTDGTVLPGSLDGYADDFDRCVGNAHSTVDPDRVYRVEVPAAEMLKVELVPDHFDGMLYLFEAGATQCRPSPLGCAWGIDSRGVSGREQLVYVNTSSVTESFFLVVDSTTPRGVYRYAPRTGRFTLRARTYAGVSLAHGQDCAATTSLPTDSYGMFVSAGSQQYWGGFSPGTDGTCSPQPIQGSVQPFEVTIPAGQRLDVSAFRSIDGSYLSQAPVVITVPDCPATGISSCLSSPASFAERIESPQEDKSYANLTGSPRSVWIGLAANYLGAFNPNDLFFVLATLEDAGPATPLQDTCTGAAAAPPTRSVISLSSLANDYASPTATCIFGSGKDGALPLSIPPHKRLRADLDPLGATKQYLSLMSSCPSGCIPRVYNQEGAGDTTVLYNNASGTGETLYLVVDQRTPFTTDGYELVLTIDDPIEGDLCATAIPISGSGSYLLDARAATLDYAPDGSCQIGSLVQEAVDVVYQISLPAGQEVTVAPEGQLKMALVDGIASCDATPSCVASDDGNVSGATMRYRNSGASTATIYLMFFVTRTAYGRFDVTIAP
ncbi:MAG: hypothetical protein IT384_34800 [Deltaproteobacteria bacterium]|nr:hypothetical protein [Deltaproteobacteria bacterium]